MDTREVQVPVQVLQSVSNYFTQVVDLKPADFHVDVRGEEQQISQVKLSAYPVWDIHDDYGYHIEGDTGFGLWLNSDSNFPWSTIGRLYIVTFLPSEVASGSCYKVTVKVDRPGVEAFYPDEFCSNTSPADPLGDTRIGLRLQGELTSQRSGHISITSSEGSFLSRILTPSIHVSLEFPTFAFRLQEHLTHVSAPVGLLGTISLLNEKQVSQFSDSPAGSDYWIVDHHSGPYRMGQDVGVFFDSYNRYMRQFSLPTGDYSLKLILDNGGEFGRVEMSIKIPAFDSARLWLSTVFLCRRFHKPTREELEKLPLQYTPLMSQGTEFEPAGDTRFTKDERLLLWFQVYAPPGSVSMTSSIHYKVKVTNLQTNKIESDGGMEGIHDFIDGGKPTIPIWKEIAIGKLALGAYRVDVQATDSATGSTIQSSNTFTMVKKK